MNELCGPDRRPHQQQEQRNQQHVHYYCYCFAPFYPCVAQNKNFSQSPRRRLRPPLFFKSPISVSPSTRLSTTRMDMTPKSNDRKYNEKSNPVPALLDNPDSLPLPIVHHTQNASLSVKPRAEHQPPLDKQTIPAHPFSFRLHVHNRRYNLQRYISSIRLILLGSSAIRREARMY